MERSAKTKAKIARVLACLRGEEPDRVPFSDMYWGQFITDWIRDLGLPPDTDIYRHYDLDYMIVAPNTDPHIMQFEVLRETEEEVVVRTGYGSIIRKVHGLPMPDFLEWEIDSIDKLSTFEFDDPWDERRYFATGDDMINGVGDGFNRNLPPFVERAQDWAGDFMLFGSVPEGHEQIWRMVGPENTLLWIGLYPDEFGRFLTGPLCDFLAGCTEAQIKACDGIIDGFYIWGDIAYRNNMLFSPNYWRKYFKPVVTRLCEVIHSYALPVIYHTDGNYGLVFDDLIDAGVDAFHPLEVKAGFDVVELKEKQGKPVAFVGNLDAQVMSTNDLELVREEVLHKLHAAKNGGYMPQADHSVPAGVSGETYDYIVHLIREYGEYPLKLEI